MTFFTTAISLPIPMGLKHTEGINSMKLLHVNEFTFSLQNHLFSGDYLEII